MNKIVILLLLIIVGISSSASACSCIQPSSFSEEFKGSDLIFIGQPIRGELIIENDPNAGEVYATNFTFKVQEKFKGDFSKGEVAIQTGTGYGDCGYQFNFGMSYLIYGTFYNGAFHTNICTRTRPIGFYPYRINNDAREEIDNINKLKTGITIK